ncbi:MULTISPECIES: Tim44 domain-containing protein [Phenylobacterium]|uniref:Lipid-binding transport protein (Tim44 family) n=1 Tax=Phenylobacterium koreense TaxID=266125 RepID=A0ABV2EHC5_9CAUL
MTSRLSKIFAVTGLSLAMGLSLASEADARRGGSFGSRGARTYNAAPATKTAPTQAAPVQRSMTERQPGQAAATSPARPLGANPMNQRRPGLFSNPLVRGLMLGGLLGLLLGHGFGAGMAGMLGGLLQIALIAIVAMLAFRFLASRRRPAEAAAPNAGSTSFRSPFDIQQPASPQPAYAPVDLGQDLAVTGADREAFERLLREVQEAFGREDYGAIRERTTPEIMSYLAEELGQNATRGVRNKVSDIQMLEGDVAEAWSEGDLEYATAAMRYSSRDVMVDRESGAIVEGEDRPTETTELWTFVRRRGEPWKVSAIQEAA